MWHKPCRTFHPWCLCIKTRCLSELEGNILYWEWDQCKPSCSGDRKWWRDHMGITVRMKDEAPLSCRGDPSLMFTGNPICWILATFITACLRTTFLFIIYGILSKMWTVAYTILISRSCLTYWHIGWFSVFGIFMEGWLYSIFIVFHWDFYHRVLFRSVYNCSMKSDISWLISSIFF